MPHEPFADGDEPQYFLDAPDRGGTGPNGKTSFTVDEAAVQLNRAGYGWNGIGVAGQAVSVTYSFMGVAPAQMPNGTSGFSAFSALQIAQAELALQSWSDLANITFTRVGGDGYSSSSQITFANYNSGAAGAGAFGYYPPAGGGVWVNISQSANQNPGNLNYGRQTLTHEIGHTIGFQHPGDYNAGNGNPTYNDAVYYEDSRQYSLMSYWSETNTGGDFQGNYAAAPLLDDIAAVQRLYGANMTTRTGDSVYGFNSNTNRDFYTATTANSELVFAAWDAGGTDTFDFSGYADNQTIELRQGFFSNVGGLTGNVSIAMGAVIENAVGGSGRDHITGNSAANVLNGGAGNDMLYGREGNDVLLGGGASAARPSGISLGSGQLNQTANAGNNSQGTAVDLSNRFSLANDPNIGNATSTPHVTVQGVGAGASSPSGDFYRVTINNPGATIVVDVDQAGLSTPLADTYVSIFNSAGQEVAHNDDSLVSDGAGGSTSTLDSYLTYTFATAGTYYIQIRSYYGQITAGEHYRFQLSISGELGGGAEVLDGGTGADRMEGGAGDHIYYVDNVGDRVIEANVAGTDLVNSSVSFSLAGQYVENLTLTGTGAINGTGNSLANLIIGNSGNNDLDGASGADTMQGGAGDDDYYVQNAGDRVIEASGQGLDRVFSSVSFSLAGQYIEQLTLTGTGAINGTGNSLANLLVGNSGNNDLDGGTGADTMRGGAGDDDYFVQNVGDRVIEATGEGLDRVYSSVSFSLAGQYIEQLTLTGTGAINGTGNSLANLIIGNSGNNDLDGGTGADTMQGGLGDDDYFVQNSGDRVIEASGQGVDRVYSSVSFSLAGQYIERLALTGSANINANGNTLDNRIVGNSGDNVIDGGKGQDRIAGGDGRDTFAFTTALGASNVDTLTDFRAVDDTIRLENGVFTGLAAGALTSGAFYAGTAAHDANDRIIYDQASGSLCFDRDGTGGAYAAVRFAILENHAAITAADFTVV